MDEATIAGLRERVHSGLLPMGKPVYVECMWFQGGEDVEKKLSHEEFVRLAIQKLRTANYRGIHSVYSGFNEAFKLYFGGENPVEVTTRLAEAGKVSIRPVKRGVMLYFPGDGPQDGRGEAALKKMGLA